MKYIKFFENIDWKEDFDWDEDEPEYYIGIIEVDDIQIYPCSFTEVVDFKIQRWDHSGYNVWRLSDNQKIHFLLTITNIRKRLKENKVFVSFNDLKNHDRLVYLYTKDAEENDVRNYLKEFLTATHRVAVSDVVFEKLKNIVEHHDIFYKGENGMTINLNIKRRG